MAINETMIAESISSGIAESLGTGFPGMIMLGVLPLILFMLLLGILLFVVWIWMIIDCAKRNKFKSGDRVVWILLLVLTGLIGIILYYFMVMRED